MKNREKKVLKNMCFFDIHFSSLFFDFSRFWLDSMCAQRTYRRAAGGNRKAYCESHAGFRAAINALYPKTELKIKARSAENVARRHPKPLKIEPGGTQAHPDVTQRCPRAAKRHPKDTQRHPRGRQERPSAAQEAPNWRPNPSKIEPRALQEVIFRRSRQKPLFKRPWGRFLRVFCIAR